MKRDSTICLILSGIFLASALFSYIYEAGWSGSLAVMSYPLRPLAVPLAVVAVAFGFVGVYFQTHKRDRYYQSSN